MRIRLFLLLTFASVLHVHAQWTMLGKFPELAMSSNYKGLSVANVAGSTPSQGIVWSVKASQDDWVTMNQRSSGGGSDLGCCPMSNLLAQNDSEFYVTRSYTGISNVFKTTDGGVTWQALHASNLSFDLHHASHLANDNILLAGGIYPDQAAIAMQITPSGADTLFYSPVHSGEFARIQFVNNSLGFLSVLDSAGDVRLLRTADGGNSWTNPLGVGLGNFLAIEFVDAQTGYVGGSSGVFYKTTDGGLSWNSLAINGPIQCNQIEFLNADTGFVATGNGLLMRTFDGGQNWASELVDSAANLIYLKVISTELIYVQSSDSSLYKRNYIVSNDDLSLFAPQIRVFPQPASDVLNVLLPQDWRLDRLALYGLDGKILRETKANGMDVSALPKGVYVLRIETNKGIEMRKVTVN